MRLADFQPLPGWSRDQHITLARVIVAYWRLCEPTLPDADFEQFADGVQLGLNQTLRGMGEAPAPLTDIYPPTDGVLTWVRENIMPLEPEARG